MSKDLFARAREIVSDRGMLWLLQSAGVPVEMKAGHESRQDKNVKCLYPGHEDNKPSAMIYGDQRFHCFTCGTGDTPIDLLVKIKRETPVEVAKWIVGLVDGVTTPPIRKRIRPSKTKQVSKPINQDKIPASALRVLEHYWDLVKHRPLSDVAKNMIKQRGLDPVAVYDLGVRDTYEALLPTILNHHANDAVMSAGLINDSRYRFGNAYGLLIPAWQKEYAFPTSWRFRPHQPSPRGAKEYGLAGTGRSIPLGLNSLTSDGKALIICEGVPDYLSLATSSLKQSEFAVIGLLGRTLPRWLLNEISNKKKYPLIFDMTHKPQEKQDSIGHQIKSYWNDTKVEKDQRSALLVLNPPERLDWNDHLQQGDLQTVIDRLVTPNKEKYLDGVRFGSIDAQARWEQGLDLTTEYVDQDDDLPEILKGI
jgi:hypothetical protein